MTKFSNFQVYIWVGPKLYLQIDLKHKIWLFCTKLYAFSCKIKPKFLKKMFWTPLVLFSRRVVFLETLKLKNSYK